MGLIPEQRFGSLCSRRVGFGSNLSAQRRKKKKKKEGRKRREWKKKKGGEYFVCYLLLLHFYVFLYLLLKRKKRGKKKKQEKRRERNPTSACRILRDRKDQEKLEEIPHRIDPVALPFRRGELRHIPTLSLNLILISCL